MKQDTKLRVGGCYRLRSEGEEMVGWVTEFSQNEMVWFRDRKGQEFGFNELALGRMEVVEVSR